MRKLSIIVTAAAATAAPLLALAPAQATSASCGNTPRCFGVLSHQAAPLEIATAVPVNQVTGGTRLIGMTPSGSAREDFHVSRSRTGVVKFRFEPRGHRGALCITATSDLPRSRPTLEPCFGGTAGSSHQLWRKVNVIDHGFRVYRNEANGLVLTIAGTASGSPLQIRSMGLGTALNKNYALIKPF